MKRLAAMVLILAIAGGLLWLAGRSGRGDVPPSATSPATNPEPELKEDLSGRYLQGYGGPGSSPAADLVLVQDVLTAYLYTIKVPDALPTAGNREIVSALLGDNPYRIRFIDPPMELINPDGELTDRWGTPLFFHFVEAADPAIRSAGPDRRMWTGDDLLHGEFADETR